MRHPPEKHQQGLFLHFGTGGVRCAPAPPGFHIHPIRSRHAQIVGAVNYDHQMTAAHTIAIVDDHALVRDGIVGTLGRRKNIRIVYLGDCPGDVLELDVAPDVVLLDLDLAGKPASPDDAAEMIARGSAVLVVSALGSPSLIRDMVRAGVSGFVPKRDTSESLLDAIDAVLRGEPWTPPDLAAILANDHAAGRPKLSERERRVLVLYASGLKMAAVARQIGISVHSAKTYLNRVRAKYAASGLSASTKTELYQAAVRDGLIDP